MTSASTKVYAFAIIVILAAVGMAHAVEIHRYRSLPTVCRTAVLEVVELLEGEVGQGASALGPPWSEMSDQVRAKLQGTTIADVAQREAQEAGAAMYYI